MPELRLTKGTGKLGDAWSLVWDEETFTLRAGEERVLLVPTGEAYRFVDPYDLFADRKVHVTTPAGPVVFAKDAELAAALRPLVEAGLHKDAVYRGRLRSDAVRALLVGPALFLVGGGLFGLYCWYASWAPDPPPGHWVFRIGWLIHLVLLILLGAAVAGPFIGFDGLRQLARVRRVERQVPEPPAG